MPTAHTGASCGNREFPSVSRLASKAMPETLSVSVFSAAVTANVRLNMQSKAPSALPDRGRCARSNSRIPSHCRNQAGDTSAVSHRRLMRVCGICGQCEISASMFTAQLSFGIAVIGIDAGDLELPGPARRRHFHDVADAHIQAAASCSLMKHGIARHADGPRRAARFPAAASARDRARDRAGRQFHRLALHLRLARPPDRIAGTSLRSFSQLPDRRALRISAALK